MGASLSDLELDGLVTELYAAEDAYTQAREHWLTLVTDDPLESNAAVAANGEVHAFADRVYDAKTAILDYPRARRPKQ